MIDIHTHLLPAVDDGSRSLEQSLAVLRDFHAGGVNVVVCTPHLDASNAERAPFDHHANLLEGLRAAAPWIQLRSGWEIMLDTPSADLSDPRLGLGGGDAVLVEFPRTHLPPNSTDELLRLRMSGRLPVVAHPERYVGCTTALVGEWRDAGAVIQMDIAAVVRNNRMSDLSRGLLAEGLIDIFASDTHGDRRSLVPAREWLAELGSDEHVELLTKTNAERLLAGQEPLRVPPLRITVSLFDRLLAALSPRRRRR